MKQYLAFFIACLQSCGILWAQDSDPFSFHTNIQPSAAAYEMVRQGKIEPSLYTGEMRYSLPIYTYHDPDFTIPVSLEYSFGGYKPSQGSGSVGMGWHLNCGGVITREVIGLPDEYQEGNTSGYFWGVVANNYPTAKARIEDGNYQDGYVLCQQTPFLPSSCIASIWFGASPLISDYPFSFYVVNKQVFYETVSVIDASSDLYRFVLPDGNSGSFVILPSGEIKVYDSSLPPGEVSIIIDYPANHNQQERIILKTSDGFKFIFGGQASLQDISFDPVKRNYRELNHYPKDSFSALKLERIIAPNGRIACFEYETDHTYMDMAFMDTHFFFYDMQGPLSFDHNSENEVPRFNTTLSHLLRSIKVNNKPIISFGHSDKRYQEYGSDAFSSSYENNIEIFPLNDNWSFDDTKYLGNNRLSYITIRNDEGYLIDSVCLSHNYTSSLQYHSPKMFLSSVSGRFGEYSFSYNNATSNTNYPPIDCKHTDHWGYWRGSGGSIDFNAIENNTLQESSLYDGLLNGRAPDSSHTSFGALRRISYPSGGYTDIEYERHHVNKRIDIDLTSEQTDFRYHLSSCSSNYMVGGLRVKKIVNHSGSNGSYKDSVSYFYGTAGYGTLVQMPRYRKRMASAYFAQGQGYYPEDHTVFIGELGVSLLDSYSNTPSERLGSKSNGHVTYNTVKEIYADSSETLYSFADYSQYEDVYLTDDPGIDTVEAYRKVLYVRPNLDPVVSGFVNYEFGFTSARLFKRNTAIANILLTDYSSVRGRLLNKEIINKDGLSLQSSHYHYAVDTACLFRQIFNCFTHLAVANRVFVQPRLDSVITTEYLPGGGTLSDTTLYTYNNLGQQTVVEKRGFDGSIRRSRLRYEHENDTTAPRANVAEAATTRLVGNGTECITSLRHFEYDTDSARRHLPVLAVDYGRPLPWAVSADTTTGWFSPLAPDDSVVRRLSYNTKHRPTRLSMPGNSYVAFVWDTRGRYPLSREDNGPSMVSTYQWKDMVGLTRKTDPTLRSEWYSYDDKWRLSEVRRADSVKITSYDYHLWCEDSTAGPSRITRSVWRTVDTLNKDIVYYDGLGYPIQTVRTSAFFNRGHIVTPIIYDAHRRDDAQVFLPYEANGFAYDSAALAKQRYYYKIHNTSDSLYAYTKNQYGSSPAGRLLSTRQPGRNYATPTNAQKLITYDYRTNNLSDSILDLQAVVDTSFKLKVGNGYLPAGRLLLTKTTDEDGCTSEVFTDASGKTVLSRQRTGGQRLDTYRVYDLRDSLVCVLQPEGVVNIELGSSHVLLPPPAKNSADTIPAVDDLLEKYAFLYSWDSRGRLAAKKRPGAAAEEYLSDDRGRVVLSRDGNLRSQGKWLYSEYDEYDALLKKSLISVELGLDTLRRAARGEIDSTVIDTRDTITLWAFLLNGESQDVYCKTHTPSVGDSTFFEDGTECMPIDSVGNDSQTGVFYICLGTDRFYYTGGFIRLPVGERSVTIDADWPAILANAITDSTLLEEHRYDRGDGPGIPQALDFIPVTGIVAAADTGSTRNLEVWQRQLMLPPGRTVPGDTTRYVERVFFYNEPGNLVQTVEKNIFGGISRTSVRYNYLGDILYIEERHDLGENTTPDVKRVAYAYDRHGRVAKEIVTVNGSSSATVKTEFDYDIFGRLTQSGYQEEGGEYGFWETNTYDIRGRLLSKEATRIAPNNNPGGGNTGGEEEEDDPEEPEPSEEHFVFGEYLKYYNPTKAASTLRWNGLISEIRHQHGDAGPVITNSFFYDTAGRMTDNKRYSGNSLSNKYTERDLGYDRNGNILTLKRYGATATAPQDNLSYTYTGNKLMQLNSWEYAYDANGNMTSDGRRHLQLSWNHLNLPATIINDEDEDATVNYTYLADGTKVLAQAPGTSEGYAYLGTMVYKLNNGNWTLETTPFTGGRFVRNATGNLVEQRHITDHLGSTRSIVEGDNYTEVEQNDYYPFGKRIADNTLPTTPTNRWRFSGKEIQTLGGINLIDFGARLYDDAIVRWPTQDALAEKHSGFSPYCYCSNNPISFMDPDGKDVVDKIAGVLIGVATNIIPGSGSLRDTYSPTSTEDYNNTLERVDDITVKVGIATIGVGTAGAIAGTTATATGGAAAATVVGAPAGVAVAAVGATEAAVAVTAVAAGSLLTMNAASNKSAGHYRGKASGKNERHGDSGRALEKAKKKIQALEAEKQGLPKKEREKIQTRIERIRKTAYKKLKGVEHHDK